ncbi:MAG: ATP-binding cassette domain-containing protein [Thermaerobacter sp.]|nr:ATP-binding cassette domain-containing protein [Thermaerobacter sp.]
MFVRNLLNRVVARDLVIVFILLIVVPPFLGAYVTSLVGVAVIYMLLAVSLDIAWGYTGILSLGQSVFFGLGGYTVSIVLLAGHGVLHTIVAIGLGVLLPAVAALLIGWILFFTRSSQFYVSVVTLALAVLASEVVLQAASITGGANGLPGVPGFALGPMGNYYIVLGVAGLTLAAAYIFTRSDFGKVVVAVRDNEERMSFLGYNAPAIKTIALTLSALIAGVAGVMYAPYQGFVSPNAIGFSLATQAVIWVAIGGRGKLIGAVVGALLVNILAPVVQGVLPFVWGIAIGLVFIIVVLLVPNGLYSLFPWAKGQTLDISRITALIAPRKDAERVSVPLSVRKLQVSHGALRVLREISFELRPKQLRSLIGPNGAGKSTLVDAITGRVRPSAGEVVVEGSVVSREQPERIVRRGVARTFQTANVVESLSVAQNLQLAAWRGRLPSLVRRTHDVALPIFVEEALNHSQISEKLNKQAQLLSHGERKVLELFMVLATQPDVLLLDEPTAGLTVVERRDIGELLRRLCETSQVSIMMIEHDIEFVKSIADEITLLHDGIVAASGSVSEMEDNEVVRSVYLGGVQA